MKPTGESSICLSHQLVALDKEIQEKAAKEIIESNNFSSFHSEELQGDFPTIPVDGDFVSFPFRQLSATIVGAGGWKATDFQDEKVLKASMPLLKNKAAYLNHDISVGKDVGYIGNVTFRKAYKNSKGDQIPSGIEAPFVIDKVLHPKLVRRLTSPVSPIKSSSVTVFYEWEASHDFEDEGDFFWHLGEEIDGEIVRRIATNIQDYNESSMVWLGADPFAGMLDENGQVVNIDRSSLDKNPFKEDKKHDSRKKYFVFDCLDDNDLLHLGKSFGKNPKDKEQKGVMKELLKHLAQKFDTTVEALEDGSFTLEKAKAFGFVKQEELTAFKANADKVVTLEGEKTTLEKEVTSLKGEVKTLTDEKTTLEKEVEDGKEFVKVGESTLKAAKEKAVKLYGIFAKGNPDKEIVAEIESHSDIDMLNRKINMFGGQVMNEFSGYCTECDSDEHVEFRSSVEPGNDTEDDNKEAKSMSEHFRQ